MPDGTIAIKGVNDGLLIELHEAEEWNIILLDLGARLDGQSTFYQGARVTLDTKARPVRKDELGSLRALLERRGMTLTAVHSASTTTIDAAFALDLRAVKTVTPAAAINGKGTPMVDGMLPINPEEDGTVGVMIRRTLRSGRSIHSQGHVVVYGDVNAGAEIVAVGDVIVWGRLRGNVHAGANGDESAVICALDMSPTQLRIARYITVSPPDKRRKPKPETALIRDRQIVVESWQ